MVKKLAFMALGQFSDFFRPYGPYGLQIIRKLAKDHESYGSAASQKLNTDNYAGLSIRGSTRYFYPLKW